jgi:hypothetical protein
MASFPKESSLGNPQDINSGWCQSGRSKGVRSVCQIGGQGINGWDKPGLSNPYGTKTDGKGGIASAIAAAGWARPGRLSAEGAATTLFVKLEQEKS